MIEDKHWRTPAVVALCRGMREAQDYTLCPALADALEAAGWHGDDFLGAVLGLSESVPDRLRGPLPVAQAERLVAQLYSDETAAAVDWLDAFVRANDTPGYDDLVNGAAGRTGEVGDGDPEAYHCAVLEDAYLHFGGVDAHGPIPPAFWDNLELVTGRPAVTRPSHFSCSC